ncbi:MAG TPA: aminoglycoside 6-adenylyltransferase [Gelidibacter sp.]|uniref:aminoglycoside 6-adenylyltransferase n=1 Tax=Gelidibacter sp. TaxID=2018083 RepID=UPI002C3CB005|nr:aminoglycoside 6-adenylyltransferase [Gelidibacter sp.]HXJ99173.1 aminoglycoside 6-adenylyltransferase [Gelidibacter sp.]
MKIQDEIQSRILNIAQTDDRIRAVILNGSRANAKVTPDAYQDYDIVFIVKDFDQFLNDRNWINLLGTPILQQLPDEMELGKDENHKKFSFTFLMIFDDGNRIDLTLFPYEKFDTHFEIDSLTLVLLDKDQLFKTIPEPSDVDYHIKRPTQKQFMEVCNEFWWTATYVAKGLKRKEIIYAKEMMETVVRPMFWQLLEWHIGSEHDFKVSAGKSGKFADKFLSEALYKAVLKTYSNANLENNWNALFLMLKLFKKQQKQLAEKLHFEWNQDEAENSGSRTLVVD